LITVWASFKALIAVEERLFGVEVTAGTLVNGFGTLLAWGLTIDAGLFVLAWNHADWTLFTAGAIMKQ
jgi:hypothetical protein